MHLFVSILHVFLCFVLILVILLQPGKEGSGALTGGGNAAYGPRANAHPLSRATSVVAVLFMLTSITLALFSSEQYRSDSNVEDALKRLQKEEAESSPRGEAPAFLDNTVAPVAPPTEGALDAGDGAEGEDQAPDGSEAAASGAEADGAAAEGASAVESVPTAAPSEDAPAGSEAPASP